MFTTLNFLFQVFFKFHRSEQKFQCIDWWNLKTFVSAKNTEEMCKCRVYSQSLFFQEYKIF